MCAALRNRVALVTGATRRLGIGAAIARELAAAGADVLISFYRAYDATMPWGVARDEPEALIEELRQIGVRAEAVRSISHSRTRRGRSLSVPTQCSGAWTFW
jgi:3-oxoacyl-[acyl-carrier protein] reductase